MTKKTSGFELPRGLEVLVHSEVQLMNMFVPLSGAPTGLLYKEHEEASDRILYIVSPADAMMLQLEFTKGKFGHPNYPMTRPRYELAHMTQMSFIGVQELGINQYGPAFAFGFKSTMPVDKSAVVGVQVHLQRGTLLGKEDEYTYISRVDFVDAAERFIEKVRSRRL